MPLHPLLHGLEHSQALPRLPATEAALVLEWELLSQGHSGPGLKLVTYVQGHLRYPFFSLHSWSLWLEMDRLSLSLSQTSPIQGRDSPWAETWVRNDRVLRPLSHE